MAIRIPSAGSIVSGTFSVATPAAAISGLDTKLTAAGWTSANTAATVNGTFSGTGANNDTITINGIVYTLKTTINNANAREVLIGASATDTAANLAAAITGGSGSGTLYSSATSASTVFTASAASGVLTVSSILTGTGNKFSVSESSSAFAWQGGMAIGCGKKFTSAATPDGRQMVVKALESDWTDEVRFIVESVDGTWAMKASLWDTAGGNMSLRTVAARSLSIAANAHQFVFWLANDYATIGTMGVFSCPYVPTHLQGIGPSGISSISNASPIVVTTSSAHGFTTGDYVDLSNVLGNTAANGNWQITVTSSTAFQLDGSTGNGAWTSGTGVIAGPGKIAQIFYCSTDGVTSDNSFSAPTLRKDLNYSGTVGTGVWKVNNYTLFGAPFSFVFPVRRIPGGNCEVIPIIGNSYWLSEARIAWPYTSGGGQVYELGELWAAFLTGEAGSLRDTTKTGFNGHDWTLYSKSADCSLWIATS